MADHGDCPFCEESMNGEDLLRVAGRPPRPKDLRIRDPEEDGVVIFNRCPFCGFRWPAVTSGPLHDRAVRIEATEVFQERFTADQRARFSRP